MAKGETYEEFVEKFKPKHTTDDCFTPQYIYDVVAEYVENRYGIDRSHFVRPFWPGGDYQNFEYPEGCVVVDNPPFSIYSKIIKFYGEHNIRYFLFCQSLTAFRGLGQDDDATIIGTGYCIEYENGAKVSTSFVSNMEKDIRVRTAPDLYRMLEAADRRHKEETKTSMPKYTYPDNVLLSVMLNQYAKYGVEYSVSRDESMYFCTLDSQRSMGKTVFGGGLLISENAAAEKTAAENAAAENAAAESSIVWTLSDREKEIVRKLGETKKAQKTV